MAENQTNNSHQSNIQSDLHIKHRIHIRRVVHIRVLTLGVDTLLEPFQQLEAPR